MKVATLDDYQNAALRLADWSAVRRHAEITEGPVQRRSAAPGRLFAQAAGRCMFDLASGPSWRGCLRPVSEACDRTVAEESKCVFS